MEKKSMMVKKPSDAEIAETRNWGTWSKEVSVFNWEYDESETCYILEGSAKVTDRDGNSIEFRAGDMVRFEQGLACTWQVTSPIKKKYRFGN
jgi:uncharacterized cupin superfamily protein